MNIKVEQWDPKETEARRLSVLVYGESGVGKTVFASTWPNVIFLDADKGLTSVQIPVDYITINSWLDLRKAFAALRQSEHNFKTVVVDSLNALQDLQMRETVEGFPGIKRPYGSVPAESDYRKTLYDFGNLIEAFVKGLPRMHVILTAFATQRIFENDYVMPQLVGKASAKNVCRLVDIVGFMYRHKRAIPGQDRSETIPVISFSETTHVSKDRTWSLPPSVDLPTYEKLAAYWSVAQRREVIEEPSQDTSSGW